MAWLNYHHLLYFWTVARTGSIARASQELHLSQPTISHHLRLLKQAGVVQSERRGPWAYYTLDPAVAGQIDQLRTFLSAPR